jgi:retinol dehydrogenase-12
MEKLEFFLRKKEFLECFNSFKYPLVGALTLAVTMRLLKVYFEGGKCTTKTRLDGKTAVITGANTGIGKETALGLAKRGARVILACRDLKKAEEAAVEIRHKSGNKNVVVERLDLASLKSVEEFAKRINQNEKFINLLINNAGKEL